RRRPDGVALYWADPRQGSDSGRTMSQMNGSKQSLTLLRHPEVPARSISGSPGIGHSARASKDDRPGPSPFEAPPAQEAGVAPQGDGYERQVQAAKSRLRFILPSLSWQAQGLGAQAPQHEQNSTFQNQQSHPTLRLSLTTER